MTSIGLFRRQSTEPVTAKYFTTRLEYQARVHRVTENTQKSVNVAEFSDREYPIKKFRNGFLEP
jgi:hypothetical protein